jgi:AraC-like DNA-binding protein
MVDFEEPLRTDGKKLPSAWVGGPSDSPDLVELGKRQTALDLKLTPLGAYTLLGTPPRQLFGAVVSLEEVLGSAGRDLVDRLRDASSWERRFDLLETFLLQGAETGPQPSPAVARAWSRLCSTAGMLSIGDLAAELQMSRRHLTATFHEQVGVPPKTAARLLRFARVRKRLQERPVQWAEVAQECGYCDQSHLNRDFNDFAGTTPSDFLGSLPFVQDRSSTVF